MYFLYFAIETVNYIAKRKRAIMVSLDYKLQNLDKTCQINSNYLVMTLLQTDRLRLPAEFKNRTFEH